MIKHKHPKYVRSFVDRHGVTRFYFRRGNKNVALPGLPWSPTFMAAYETALNHHDGESELGASRTKAGTVNAALISYYQSRAFTEGLAKVTQQNRRTILEQFRSAYGNFPVAQMHTTALQKIIDKKSPASQRNFKRAMRGLIDFCVSHSLMKVDPLAGLKMAKMKTKGHHTWTEKRLLNTWIATRRGPRPDWR
jgi:hypothetical protein